MKLHAHLVGRSDECTGGPGGAEDDSPWIRPMIRLSALFSAMGGMRVTIHQPPGMPAPGDDSEAHRLFFVSLRNAMTGIKRREGDYQHVLISFYLTDAGYVAQQVADGLELPHVACIRGEDFNRDFRSPENWAGMLYVLRRAAVVVTANREQELSLRPLTGPLTRLHTIPDALPEPLEIPRWTRTPGAAVRLITDSGFARSKATHMLLGAFANLRRDGLPLRLMVAGPTEAAAADWWSARSAEHAREFAPDFSAPGPLSTEALVEHMARADVYCSASLGEGCASGLAIALCMGMPAVATLTGVVPEIRGDAPRLAAVPAADPEAFEKALRKQAEAVRRGAFDGPDASADHFRQFFASTREREGWARVFEHLLRHPAVVIRQPQKRVMFLVSDGDGVGHLKRVAHLAGAVQGPCAALIVSGHREAAWMTPEACEYVHLPGFDSLLPERADYWSRHPFMTVGRVEAVALRRSLVRSVVDSFKPDALVVESAPRGRHGELEEIVRDHAGPKIFLARGIPDNAWEADLEWHAWETERSFLSCYDRVLVASDPRVREAPDISEKLGYIGFISEPVTLDQRLRVRVERGVPAGDRWVVCSAGGGARGEELIDACLALAREMPSLHFDVVCGPRSRRWEWTSRDAARDGRIALSRETRGLPLLHASADVVICGGGYSTLVEAMEGGARILDPVSRNPGLRRRRRADHLLAGLPGRLRGR
ncbi:MAG: glycosyltransferase [Armatimonadetes bacterium]|nr:glycosyltransferase [Armatimonadota bacterium]